MRFKQSKNIALGGILAALAATVFCFGGMIPFATYVCPILCILTLNLVLRLCGSRIAWAWYGAVAIVSLLLAPDKEAALVFSVLGYYPILRTFLIRSKLGLLYGFLIFNAAILLLYALLLRVFGMYEVILEIRGLGTMGAIILLLAGNVIFFLTDRLLLQMDRKMIKHH